MLKLNGYEVVCPICKGKKFSKRNTLLNTRGMTFLKLDWLNESAINYICNKCGYILWFIDDGRDYVEEHYVEKKNDIHDLHIDYETSKANEDECPICFSKRNVNDKECTNCGYKF
ncbi:hypothetical protein [Acetivibrio straminisolvens]|jgi:rubrerythrin|uniref:DNA-binding protein n=1 Tax=Acetivibrio straminisolvens JCM 21531 TaxID=1294263 RepID=W4V2N7_9FIRM|nr:hypothetical protein [Acetivibrio straminisolvens]GAE86974.1 hypothetical protein JCM21531_311 [Acetivibrio straminisolvens JCM 21531]